LRTQELSALKTVQGGSPFGGKANPIASFKKYQDTLACQFKFHWQARPLTGQPDDA
jgi:hypothetical protein